MIQSSVATVGTAETILVKADSDPQHVYITNLQPAHDPDQYARDGYVYLLGREFSITSPGTATFAVTTGAPGCQFEFYDIVSDNMNVRALLYEGGTATLAGTPIPAYNLNRNYADNHQTEFDAVTAYTPGTVISRELVTVAKGVGGHVASVKVHTLEPNTTYVMQFANLGNQTTNVLLQLGFSEQYNGQHDLHLGAAGSAAVLRGGESTHFDLFPGDTLVGQATDADIEVGIMRQVY